MSYFVNDTFDWLAIVLLNCDDKRERRSFLIPRSLADSTARQNSPTATNADERYWRIDEIAKLFQRFEDNFNLARQD